MKKNLLKRPKLIIYKICENLLLLKTEKKKSFKIKNV